MPRSYLLIIYARFSGKKRTLMCISWQKGNHYYIQTRHNNFFSHYNLFIGKLKENWPEKHASILMRVYRIMLILPRHPKYSLNPINSIWPPYLSKGLFKRRSKLPFPYQLAGVVTCMLLIFDVISMFRYVSIIRVLPKLAILCESWEWTQPLLPSQWIS